MHKKEKNKYINIMIVPDSKHEIKSFKVSIPFIKSIALTVFALFFSVTIALIYFGGINAYLYTTIKQKDEKIAELSSIKNNQDKKIAMLNENAKIVDNKIKSLNELEEKVKRLVGLSSSNTSRGGFSRDKRSITYDNETTSRLTSEINQKTEDYKALLTKVADRLDYLNSIPSSYPVQGIITSPFGSRKSPYGSYTEFHPGIDIAVDYGTPVRAAGKGVITYAGWISGYGKAVIIDHGYGITSVYGHNSQLLVKVGQSVNRGDIIAKSGDTGRSTGPHVHFEVRVNGNPVSPMTYLAKGN